MSRLQCRIERLRRVLSEMGVSAMYVRSTPNIEWLSGFQDVFDEEGAHAMWVDGITGDVDGRSYIHTDSRYITAMMREAADSPIQVDAEAVSMSAWAASHFTAGKVAIEDSMSLFEYRQLCDAFSVSGVDGKADAANDTSGDASDAGAGDKADAADKVGAVDPFVETNDLIVGLRSVKDDGEIASLRAAQAITDEAFSHICTLIRPGMTERDLQLALDGYMLSHGASGLAFQTIVASGPNGASPHALVSDRVIEAGECIVMDFGARRAGYCSDMTRTVFLGEPEGEMLRAWETLRAANEHVEGLLRPGITGSEVHNAALDILAQGGFAGRMGHGLGHGVGIEVHELPVLSPRNTRPLVKGNVVTVEPGIYIPDRFGMRLEDFGVITDDGFEVFTQSTHDMVVL